MSAVRAVITLGSNSLQFEGPEDFVEKLLRETSLLRDVESWPSTASHLNSNLVVKDALDHAWQWFSLHATHRMQGVNFFLVSVAFLSTAYVTALRISDASVALVVGALGVLVSVCFSRLDLRIRELIQAGESALAGAEGHLAEMTQVAELNIVRSVEVAQRRFTRYSVVIGTVHWLVGLTFAVGTLYAVWLLM